MKKILNISSLAAPKSGAALLATLLLAVGFIALGFTVPALLQRLVRPIEFISLESKDPRDVHMKNKVLFKPGFKRDVWYMWQGLQDDSSPLDLLAIVVENKTATFFQLDPNKSNVNTGKLVPVPYRASCMSCHSNGPRAMRPKKVVARGMQATFYRLTVALLNIRIKLYGSLENKPYAKDKKTIASFHPLKPSQVYALDLESCIKCHAKGGIRAPLTNEQWWTARHLVSTGSMPPWPYQISSGDKAALLGSGRVTAN